MQVKMMSNCVAGCGIIGVNAHKVGMISADDKAFCSNIRWEIKV